MVKKVIRVGTRGSQLALYQADQVKSILNRIFPEFSVSIVKIQTKGDKILDTALSKIGDKGLFTKEIENALLEKKIDIAVHSLKDLSTTIPPGLKIGAFLKRGEFRDALVHKDHKKINELTCYDIIATSSLRRKAGLAVNIPTVKTIDIRGNVNTRIKKMENGFCDGMIMAAAGLIRIGLEKYISEYIDPGFIVPAVGQGAIAVECRDDQELLPILQVLDHESTRIAVTAERTFLQAVEGGCQVPVGALCQINENKLSIRGFIASLDGTKSIFETLVGNIDDPENLGKQLAAKIINCGGNEILADIRKSV
jgi:hydroxymethylbilane synthase